MCMPAECRSPGGLAGSGQLLTQEGVVRKKLANAGANPGFGNFSVQSFKPVTAGPVPA